MTMSIRTRTVEAGYLAHLALVNKLFPKDDLLEKELIKFLKGKTNLHIALTFVDDVPACVCVISSYWQIMSYTRPKFRRMGLGIRTARAVIRKSGLHPCLIQAGPGPNPKTSRAFFERLRIGIIYGQ